MGSYLLRLFERLETMDGTMFLLSVIAINVMTWGIIGLFFDCHFYLKPFPGF